MIQCDTCNVWQHGPCMGVWADEEAPDGESPQEHLVDPIGQEANESQSTFVKNVDLTYMVLSSAGSGNVVVTRTSL